MCVLACVQVFVPSNTLKQWQVEMASLLRRQQDRGGTIDDTGGISDVIDDTWVSLYEMSMITYRHMYIVRT